MTLLDRRLAVTGGPVRPVRLNLTDAEIDALVAFLHTLTDDAFLTDPKFADPFAPADANRNGRAGLTPQRASVDGAGCRRGP